METWSSDSAQSSAPGRKRRAGARLWEEKCDDRWSEIIEKVSDYVSAGVGCVWIVDSRLRKVFAYRSLNEVVTFGESDLLSDEELLPGFSCRLADLFSE